MDMNVHRGEGDEWCSTKSPGRARHSLPNSVHIKLYRDAVNLEKKKFASVMSEIKNRERILEAIDQLRRRKARPDAERICNFLLRRFAVDAEDTKADLERLVKEDVVIRVEYKGNISYRNAAKWSRYAVYAKNKLIGFNPIAFSSLDASEPGNLSNAVAHLIIEEPDYLDFGVPHSALEKYLQERDSVRFSKKNLEAILQRELASGDIVKLENGNYSLAHHPVPPCTNITNNHVANEPVKILKMDSPNRSEEEEEEEQLSMTSSSKSPTPTASAAKPLPSKSTDVSASDSFMQDSPSTVSEVFRDGSKRKRSKKVFFDPSDIHIPTRKRGRPLGATNKNKDVTKTTNNNVKLEPDRVSCCVCGQGQDRRGQFEKFVACIDCTNKAHPGCVEFANTTDWQCNHCKSCCVCSQGSDKGVLVICCGCNDAYHLNCHNPPVPEAAQKSDFVCSQCLPPAERASTEHLDVPVDDKIPDVSGWSVEQVAKYLEDQGYPVQADVFRDHAIDGASLLLMKRSDVLVGLRLKLGPALKIYGQVKKLQIRQSDPTLLWP